MNRIMRDYYPLFEGYQALRKVLTDILDDEKLSFRPTERNPSLRALCREIGEVQVAYTCSFRTFKSDFSYRHEEATTVENSYAAQNGYE